MDQKPAAAGTLTAGCGAKRTTTTWLGIGTALLLTAPANGAVDPLAAKADIDVILAADYPRLDALYKDIHAHPELRFQEVRTAALLAKELREIGFKVTEKVGGTGVVGVYHNGAGPTVLVRTELDALPMEEKTGLPYASRVQIDWNGARTFVAHSCGHDIHMAAWVGTARALVQMKSGWRGTLVFVGQPAEEGSGGAKAMFADGLYTRFPKPDYALALHDFPRPYGTVGYHSGPASSNSDTFTITFKGRGGHGAAPNRTIDPVLIAARFVVDVQALVSREKDPLRPGVVTVGSINGGTVGNIIPDEVTVRGTIRNYDEDTRSKLAAGVVRVAKAEAAMAAAPEPMIALSRVSDAFVNDPALTERMAVVFKAVFGEQASAHPNPITASDDWSEYRQGGVPTLLFLIGIYEPKRVSDAAAQGEELPPNHSPLFAPVPEPTIRTGVQAMSVAVLDLLGR